VFGAIPTSLLDTISHLCWGVFIARSDLPLGSRFRARFLLPRRVRLLPTRSSHHQGGDDEPRQVVNTCLGSSIAWFCDLLPKRPASLPPPPKRPKSSENSLSSL
jgi:hypothetical protein